MWIYGCMGWDEWMIRNILGFSWSVQLKEWQYRWNWPTSEICSHVFYRGWRTDFILQTAQTTCARLSGSLPEIWSWFISSITVPLGPAVDINEIFKQGRDLVLNPCQTTPNHQHPFCFVQQHPEHQEMPQFHFQNWISFVSYTILVMLSK